MSTKGLSQRLIKTALWGDVLVVGIYNIGMFVML